MRNWQAACTTWQKREQPTQQKAKEDDGYDIYN